MAVRFRIRTSAGQELSFASHETFEDFVRDGDLSPDDLIYDGDTGSWSPARTHPIVLEIGYERGDDSASDVHPSSDLEMEAPEVKGRSEGPRAGELVSSAADTPDGDLDGHPVGDGMTEDEDLGLSLAPAEPDSGTGADLADEEGRPRKQGGPGTGTEASDAEVVPAAGERSLGDHRVSRSAGGDPDEQEIDPVAADGSDTLEELSGLELIPPDDPRTDEETRAFVERMEAEREADFGRGASGVPRGGGAGAAMGDAAPLGELPGAPGGEAAGRAKTGPAPFKTDRPRSWERAESSPPWRATVEDRTVGSEAHAPTRAGRGARVVGLATVILLLGGTGGYAGFRLVNAEQPSPPTASPSEPMRPMEVVAEAPTAEPDPVIASTPGALRERARERFLTATRAELRGLDEIPAAWASGDYIVLPSVYPEVVDVWQSYLGTIERVRAGDSSRYRAAFLAALDDAGVEGAARQERLAAGMLEFRSRTSQRDAHYRRVTELANAAIRAHSELIAAEGLILYERTGPAVESRAIGAGLSGRNAESQRLLEEVVEVLEQRLSAEGRGPGSGPNVRAWVWDGLLDAMTAG